MLRMRSFALVAPVLLLVPVASQAGPPSYVSPPNTYRYPSSRDNISPANRTTSNYFAPPQSYYLHPSYPEPTFTRRYPAISATRSPADAAGLDVPLLPRGLREPALPEKASAEIEVRVPDGAELWFNGVKTQQTGTRRVFESPLLEPGKAYAYNVKARWSQDGKEMERTLQVPVSAGARSAVDFTRRGEE